MDTCEQRLRDGITALDLSLTDAQITALLAFIKLIEKWNKAYNLTAIRCIDDMVTLHLLDSLSILPFLHGNRVIDIGTGAGLPGIPLAICRPDITFALLDSNAKKTRFVQQAILELKLKNVTVHHQRVENYQSAAGFDSILTRAFASLPDIIGITSHLLAKGGVLLAMKGQDLQAEWAQVSAKTTVIPINVPGIAAERCLIRVETLSPTEVK
jgi:16S rRNA (guanine527-N7)-methyltransferase